MKAARARSAASARNVGRRVPILRPARAGGERERAAQPKLEALSTVAARAGGPARSSGERPVMGVERTARLICGLFARATGVSLGADPCASHVTEQSRSIYQNKQTPRRIR